MSKETLEYMSQLTGPGDFAICFDGRMRAVRGTVEETLSGGKSPSEEHFSSVYAMNADSSGVNKIFMGAKMHEVAQVSLPCTRQRLTVLKRKDKFLPGGTYSTYFATFANVPLPSTTSLPRMSVREKATMFPCGSHGEPPSPRSQPSGTTEVCLCSGVRARRPSYGRPSWTCSTSSASWTLPQGVGHSLVRPCPAD